MSGFEDHLEDVFGGLNETRFKHLFFILVTLFFLIPLFSEVVVAPFPWVAGVLYLITFLIVLAGVTSVASHNRRVFRVTLLFSILAVSLNVLHLGWKLPGVLLAHHVIMVFITGYYIISLTRYLFICRVVTLNTIYAALSAFLLIALLWAVMFSIMDVLRPEAFSVPMEMAGGGPGIETGSTGSFHSLYFSLVTITTLGYGDIYPLTSAARMLAGAEAFTGQMFIAVMIARLVGIYSSRPSM